jgi:UDPglucose 6-dehydrogenase
MTIAVLGLGFVGLTAALGFADKGHAVRGFDVDAARAAAIADGKLPFFERGLDEALARNLNRTFFVAGSAEDAARGAELVFFCVGTPALPDGSANLDCLLSAIDAVAGTVSPKCALVIKSTVPPGTLTERIAPYIRAKGLKNPLAVNPEFLREGKCWADFTDPDRVLCGVTDNEAKSALTELYAPFGAPVRFVAPNTAEFVKYLSNSLLAVLISFSNEMALLAESAGGIDVAAAFHALNEDRRLSGAGITAYIYPGCGYGGYCLPKDTAAFAAAAKSKGFDARILGEAIALNNDMARLTARKIERAASGKTDKIGILGLSFKPESDDVRDSPAAKIIAALVEDGYRGIYAYDPIATAAFRAAYDLPIAYCASAREVCEICGTVAVVTAWDEFTTIKLDYKDIRLVDCRYCMEG